MILHYFRFLDYPFGNGLDNIWRWLQVAKGRRIADGQGDHLFLGVGGEGHRLQDVPDRVECVHRHLGSLNAPGLLAGGTGGGGVLAVVFHVVLFAFEIV